jgi:hypothetical protein
VFQKFFGRVAMLWRLDVAGTARTDQRIDRGLAMPRSTPRPILCMKSLFFFRTTTFKWHMEQGNMLNLNLIGI